MRVLWLLLSLLGLLRLLLVDVADDADDALELLGPSTVDSRVRAFAVKQLMRADDDVSELYLKSNIMLMRCVRNCFSTYYNSFKR